MRSKLFLLSVLAVGLLASAAGAQSYALTNARIVTVSGATIEKGTLVIRDGVIEAVGPTVKPPGDAVVFDVSGSTVYPGFIDSLTTLGMTASATPSVPQGRGQQAAQPSAAPTSNSNFPVGFRPEDSAESDIRAGDAQFEANRNAGFTTALTVGRIGIFNGRSVVIDLAGDSVSAMLLKSPFGQHVTFTTLGYGSYPNSLLGTFSSIRQMFYDTLRQQQIEDLYYKNPKGIKRPDADRSLEALIPALDRNMPVIFNANSEREIVRALDLIKEFNLVGIIAGGTESWKVADRLKAQNVAVLLSVNLPKRTTAASPEADPEDLETLRLRAEAPKCAARLSAAGVKFAFQSDYGRSVTDFFANVQKMIDGGLDRDKAIRAMTLGSAEILGIADRTGSIDIGKIANVAVVKGDLFGKDRYVSHIFVDGKIFEHKEPAKADGRDQSETLRNTQAVSANISGVYAVTIDIPGRPLQLTFNFTQAGTELSGSITGPTETTPFTGGKAGADGFDLTATVPYGGEKIDISVHGKVSGSTISGTLSSAQGTVPFSGTRKP